MSGTIKITLMFEHREDGGLRLWSPELPGLALSNSDPFMVIADISPALKVFYEQRKITGDTRLRSVAEHIENPDRHP